LPAAAYYFILDGVVKAALRLYAPPAAVVAAALAVRLLYFAEFRDLPLFNAPTGDTVAYASQAQTILRGDFLGDDVYFHSSPAYPYFLAAVELVTRGDLADFRAVALLQLFPSSPRRSSSSSGGACSGPREASPRALYTRSRPRPSSTTASC
jgi:hypothetical protein